MASRQAVAGALALLAEAWPREVTPQMAEVYAMALEGVSDDALGRAVPAALRDLTFFPVPAELRRLSGIREPIIDVDAVLDRIQGLASYLPTTGTTYPRVELVRERLGEAIAAAYAIAGAGRLFTGNEVGRDIARREFAAELRSIVRVEGLAALASPARHTALPTPEGPVLYGERPRGSGGPQRLGDVLPRLSPGERPESV